MTPVSAHSPPTQAFAALLSLRPSRQSPGRSSVMTEAHELTRRNDATTVVNTPGRYAVL